MSERNSNTVIGGNEVRVGSLTVNFNFSERYVWDMAIAVGEPNQLGHFISGFL